MYTEKISYDEAKAWFWLRTWLWFLVCAVLSAMAFFGYSGALDALLKTFPARFWVSIAAGVTTTLIGLMADLFKEGYGGEVDFDRDRIGVTWAQFAHMYLNFYVYQYTTGISGAHALAKPILAGDSDAAERYLGFLKAGGSRYPVDNLKQAGVDLTSPEPVESAFAYLAGLVDKLEALLG